MNATSALTANVFEAALKYLISSGLAGTAFTSHNRSAATEIEFYFCSNVILAVSRTNHQSIKTCVEKSNESENFLCICTR